MKKLIIVTVLLSLVATPAFALHHQHRYRRYKRHHNRLIFFQCYSRVYRPVYGFKSTVCDAAGIQTAHFFNEAEEVCEENGWKQIMFSKIRGDSWSVIRWNRDNCDERSYKAPSHRRHRRYRRY